MDRLAYTLCHRRSNLDWRQGIIASKASELRNALSSKDHEPIRASPALTCGFVFTGQGSQWHAMGRELLHYPVFHNSLLEADNALGGLGAQWSLLGKCGECALCVGRRGFVLDGLGLVAVIVLAFDTNLIDISRRCFYFELSFASLFVFCEFGDYSRQVRFSIQNN